MNSILEELYYGNLDPIAECNSCDGEYKRLRKEGITLCDELEKTFNDRQKEIFEKYQECMLNSASIAERDVFIYAFRLGAKMMIDVTDWGCR